MIGNADPPHRNFELANRLDAEELLKNRSQCSWIYRSNPTVEPAKAKFAQLLERRNRQPGIQNV
jgi:hypothetical protein